MMKKIWHQFLLLAVLGFMPMVSQAAQCISSNGIATGAVTTIPLPSGGWKVRSSFKFTIVQAGCNITPTQLSPLGINSNLPNTFSENGVSVKITDTKLTLASTITCVVSGFGSNMLVFRSCTGAPSAQINIEYTLTGKSTATSTNTRLFLLQVTGFPDFAVSSDHFSSAAIPINVPASTAPTCNFLIDQPNITLGTINVSDIANLTAGTAVASGQKNINITVNCAAGALSANATFAPQFSPTKSAVLTGNSSVALNDGTDNGVGFKLFDSSGTAMAFKTPLVGSTNTLFAFTPTRQTVTKPFTLKYAKTSKAVSAGPVTSSITVTFSVL